MVDISERINMAISTVELERRWAAVRAAMAERDIDVLLIQSNNDFMGGYVKYFTDVPSTNGYPVAVIFPRDEPMTVVAQGALGLDRELPPEGDGLRRGTRRFLGSPSFASAFYTSEYDAVLADRALARFATGTVGLVATAAISFALVDYLKRNSLAKANFVDASDLVDTIKSVKSEEELALIRGTAAMQDEVMEVVLKAIQPGMRDIEVAAIAEQVGHAMGSEQGLFLCSSAPVGVSAIFANRHLQKRVIQAGDQFTLLVENNGPGGLYTELGRTCVLGNASLEMKEEFAFALEAQHFMRSRLVPGTSPRELFEAYNAFMRKNGRPEERRLHSHGQGYDMVERPLIRADEPMLLRKNMNIVIHPSYATARTYSWVCDNFLVKEDGPAERLHKFPQKIFEIE
ncbi:M24 family metallopeptidase [Corallococcus terminator]|uniref:Aminopeptidase P family protein n=1 Tax=Corallococcus terminator TaxID=2316733 RepID=A0A3A8JN84_9BACT|nr:M24 family metallopeptidase [Corallococcus terminator]RKG93764.1 aminopeptidase P family protein [Corallococcus terminator]